MFICGRYLILLGYGITKQGVNLYASGRYNLTKKKLICTPARRSRARLFLVGALILLAASCTHTRKGRPAGDYLYSFIFCNDLHITTPQQAESLGRLLAVWGNDTHNIAFIVIAGDLSDSGTREELGAVREQLAHAHKPVYVLPGNHDVTGPGEAGKTLWRELFPNDTGSRMIVCKGTVLLLLDVSDGNRAHVEATEHLVNWLSGALQAVGRETPIVVFSHFPLYPQAPDFAVGTADRFFSMLDKRPVIAYFSGHYHGAWHARRNGADFYGNVSLLSPKKNHDNSEEKGYLLVDVYKDRVTVTFHEIGR